MVPDRPAPQVDGAEPLALAADTVERLLDLLDIRQRCARLELGQLGDGLFERINVQKAIVGAAGFTIESGLSDATDEEAQIKRAMVAAAREVIAIVDHTKWERAAFATFCQTDQIDEVLTDDGAPASMIEAVTARGIHVRVAAGQGSAVAGAVAR